MAESLFMTVVILIVGVRVLFAETFWIVVGGIITIGVAGYVFFWVWLFVVAITATMA